MDKEMNPYFFGEMADVAFSQRSYKRTTQLQNISETNLISP